jgi:predicted phage-related endonuclease
MNEMTPIGLTGAQVAFRSRLIGGSDANVIMGEDAGRLFRLWQEKRGDVAPEDLSNVLPVQMGAWTEPLNRRWFIKTTGRAITAIGDERISLDHPIMGCTLDGLTDDGATIFEAKHVNAFAKEDEVLLRYYPQLTHNMIVCGVNRATLSVFIGTLKHVVMDVEFDADYAAALIAAEERFWACVETGAPPCATPDVKIKIPAIRRADMRASNAWALAAHEYLDTCSAAKRNAASAKALKELVEPDVIEAFGWGVRAVRNKAGAISLKVEEA